MNSLRVVIIGTLFAIVGCATQGSNTDSKSANSDRLSRSIAWEYKIILAEYIGAGPKQERAKLFSNLGDEGWEYAGAYQPGGGGGNAWEIVFKRPKARP